ncbi:MAG TPA: amidohydrolase family protein [Oscillospiraceae bacterium]|nr:amidohydrolase family protein [Oscillospiraceae bacterium]HPS35476.1 amidohydrolase family protein [Oscillospiraceae bacterium]
MRIDDHNHADWYGYNFDRFIANMDERGIDMTWILSWECPDEEFDPRTLHVFSHKPGVGPIPFENCLAYKLKAPDRFVLGYAPDPRKPCAIDRLEAAKALYDVRVYGEIKLRMMYDNFDAIRMFRYCGKQGMPVLVHIDYEFDNGGYPYPNWWYGGGIDALERAVGKCPETNFLGHAPGFWAHISGDDQYNKVPYPTGKVLPGGKLIEMLDKYPNLYCDMSAGSGANSLDRDHEFARQFLITYQDRVLYGRDYFDNRHQEVLATLNLPQEVLDKIYYKNALKLVPLN